MTYIEPKSEKDCRSRIKILLGQSQRMITGGSYKTEKGKVEVRYILAEVDYLFDYGKINWPDEFDERQFAKVVDGNGPKFGEVGIVGYWSHNTGDVHFADGSVHSYHAMSLEAVKSSKEIRAIFGEPKLSKDEK